MAARQGRVEGGGARPDASLAEGIRTVTVLLHPYMPETAAKLLESLGEEELALESAPFGARPGGGAVGKLPQLFPKPQ